MSDFNPRFPRGKRQPCLRNHQRWRHFNPRFPRGKRPRQSVNTIITESFQSTLPAGEATVLPFSFLIPPIISIHASRGGSDLTCAGVVGSPGLFQSTLPAGEATHYGVLIRNSILISIHASRGGSDFIAVVHTFIAIFQSTLPAGEATAERSGDKWIPSDFNPRFPRGKRLSSTHLGRTPIDISIHASRGGSDAVSLISSVRALISIHASRGGSDELCFFVVKAISNFNPRFPRGKRHCVGVLQVKKADIISIHASRGGSDAMK